MVLNGLLNGNRELLQLVGKLLERRSIFGIDLPAPHHDLIVEILGARLQTNKEGSHSGQPSK